MKRKNIFKSLLGAAMALIMIFGAAPLSGFVGIISARLVQPEKTNSPIIITPSGITTLVIPVQF